MTGNFLNRSDIRVNRAADIDQILERGAAVTVLDNATTQLMTVRRRPNVA